MDVRREFKQIDLGPVPLDWAVKKLGQLGKVVRGASPRPAGDPRYFGGNSVPWLTVASLTNISESQLFVWDTASKLTEAGAKYSRALSKGTLVIVNSGARTLGVSKILGIDCCANDGIAALIDQEAGDARFICYFINSKIDRLRRVVAAGNDQLNLNTTRIAAISVPFPPPEEQQKIADALWDVDRFIEALERCVEKKRLLKQGTAQDLLSGKRRLPGFYAKWREQSFGEIFNFYPTATNSRADLGEHGDTFYIHYGDIHTRFHTYLNFALELPPRIDGDKCRNAALVRNGDWIMADASEDYGGVGKSVEIVSLPEGERAVAGLHTFLLRERGQTFAPRFKGHLGNLKSLHTQYIRVMSGMKVFGVSKAALRNIVLPIPPLHEQVAIVDILDDMGTEIATLEQKLGKARQIKRGMMQELLTGRIRLA